MPKYVKSGKYYYKVNKRTGDKIRIPKEEYVDKHKHKSSLKKPAKRTVVKKPVKSGTVADNINKALKQRLTPQNKRAMLTSAIRVGTNADINNKKYHIDAIMGKCPRLGKYVYHVTAKSVSNNGLKMEVYRRNIISNNSSIFE